MAKIRSLIDLSKLQLAAEEHDGQEALARQQAVESYGQARRREDVAWPLLEQLTALAQTGTARFDRAGHLVDAFFAVCDVMREQQLGSELDTLDVGRMVQHYCGGRSPDLANAAFQVAIEVLRQGIAEGDNRSLRRRLIATVEIAQHRHLWSMVYPVVEGLLTSQGRLFRKEESTEAAQRDSHRRRPCYDRDHLWLQWSEHDNLKPAAIRNRWNEEYQKHGGQPIGKGRSGREVVKEGLRKARAERQGVK
jgi:hypothetical protein